MFHNMKVSFTGHETFPFRYGWLKKGVDATSQNPSFFSSDRAMVTLGVGKNMVQSLKHWGVATGLLLPKKTASGRVEHIPTEMALRIFSDEGFDPFLEDPGTLWYLHWQLASDFTHSTTWYWLFNHWHSVEFNKNDIFNGIIKWLEQNGVIAPSENLLRRDIDCCLRTYTLSQHVKSTVREETFDCPLSELKLIAHMNDGRSYKFLRGEQKTLPNQILVYALVSFWDKYHRGANSIALEKVAYDPGSPGRVFKLDPESLAKRLDELAKVTNGSFSYHESAGLKQVFRQYDSSATNWLESCYSNR